MDRGCRGEIVIPEAEAPLFTPFRQKPCALTATWFSCTLSTSERKLICVTSANSFLASLILKQLLARGYLVRATVQNQGLPLPLPYISVNYYLISLC
uniref:Cinnamoyl-CoA reductase 1-like n=1 Tax=Nelumbo nucifera TaxID=4432 RepID=A0A822YUU9_NELNU|nr:TPA_asm: hypothetical protein HUJ06_005839 [Nelumbo nucifera]